ncbi:MAG: hypothetical protein LBS83_03515 [Holosporales bacterium]|jgi:hypothetical protein|nr:hypothetical protein [Holosporales bacterium]
MFKKLFFTISLSVSILPCLVWSEKSESNSLNLAYGGKKLPFITAEKNNKVFQFLDAYSEIFSNSKVVIPEILCTPVLTELLRSFLPEYSSLKLCVSFALPQFFSNLSDILKNEAVSEALEGKEQKILWQKLKEPEYKDLITNTLKRCATIVGIYKALSLIMNYRLAYYLILGGSSLYSFIRSIPSQLQNGLSDLLKLEKDPFDLLKEYLPKIEEEQQFFEALEKMKEV